MRYALPFTLPPQERLVMTLGAYFDESGTNPSDPALVMAGFISTTELWAEFSTRWREAITGWGLIHWHMTDFEARRDQFKHWPRDQESQRRLAHVLTLITSYTLATASVSFPRALFESYFESAPKAQERLYLLTAASIMHEVSYFPKEWLPGQNLALIFESGARGRHQVQQAWDALPPDTSEHLNFLSLTFAKKTEFEPLQAADILAYEQFRHYPKVWGNETRPVRYPLKQIFEKRLPHAGGVISKAFLDDMYSQILDD